MRQVFTHKNPRNRRLLLVFTGWSSDERFFAGFAPEGWDVMVCSDYETLDFDSRLIDGYSTVYLFAWSLGVAAVAASLPEGKIAAAVAVNGTLWPADDMRGIPESIFKATEANLDERNLRKFRRRIPALRIFRRPRLCCLRMMILRLLRGSLKQWRQDLSVHFGSVGSTSVSTMLFSLLQTSSTHGRNRLEPLRL